MVAIREGVLNGEFVPAEEILKSVIDWEGVPLTVGHPQQDGMFVSIAQNPELIDKWVVGEFKNVEYKNGSLTGELWIDIERANQLEEGERAINILSSGGQLEVSTGYFAADVPITGYFEGKEYSGSQRDITPDHLALLPDEIGACSWEDGCGAPRQNKEDAMEINNLDEDLQGGETNTMPNKFQEALGVIANFFGFKVYEEERVKGIKIQGQNFAILLDKIIKDQTTADRPRRDIIKEMATQAGITKEKVKEILDSNVDFIPRRWLEGFANALGTDMWDLMMVAGIDSLAFMEGSLPAFENGNPMFAFSAKTDEEEVIEDTMDKNKIMEESMSKDEIVNALISNEGNAFDETDREALESLTEEFLAKLMPIPEEDEELEVQEEHDCKCGEHVNVEEVQEELEVQVELEEEKELEVQEEQIVEDESDEEIKEVDVNEYLANMPDAVKAIVDPALKDWAAKRNSLIENIVANSDFSPEELESESDERLQKLAKLAKAEPAADYSGVGGPRNSVQDDSIPPAPPIVLAEPKKRES